MGWSATKSGGWGVRVIRAGCVKVALGMGCGRMVFEGEGRRRGAEEARKVGREGG